MMTAEANEALPRWMMTDKEKFLVVEARLPTAEEEEEVIQMTTMIEEVHAMKVVDGLEIRKVIQKLLNVAGKTEMVDAAVRATIQMTVADHVAGQMEMVMAVDGLEITKDIRKLQNADGKIVVAAEAVLTTTMILVATIQDVVVHKDNHVVKVVAGLEILKDIQKHLNADGKVAKAEEVVLTMMMIVMDQETVHAVDHVVDHVVMAVAGMEITKDILKLQNVVGKAVMVAAVVVQETMMMMIAADLVLKVVQEEAMDNVDGLVIHEATQKHQSAVGKTDANLFKFIAGYIMKKCNLFFLIFNYSFFSSL
jgi:hypothetical protein